MNFKKIISGTISLAFISAFIVPWNNIQQEYVKSKVIQVEATEDNSSFKTYSSWNEAYNNILQDDIFFKEIYYSGYITSNNEEPYPGVQDMYFDLIYLDDDDIPELVVYFDSGLYYSGPSIVKYDENTGTVNFIIRDDTPTIHNSEYGASGCLQYIEKKGIIYDDEAHGGDQTINIFNINGYTAELKEFYRMSSPANDSIHCYDSNDVEISINEIATSLKKYNLDYTGINDMKYLEFTGYKTIALSDDGNLNTEANREKIILQNKCGDNATWSLDKTTGTLTISGTGDMYDYESVHFSTDNTSAPWMKEIGDTSEIKEVIIKNGITSIGAYAFYDLSYISYVSLPDTLTKIGKEAFVIFDSYSFCENMFHTITIPSSVKIIEEDALGYYDSSYLDENGDLQYADRTTYDLTIKGYIGSQAQIYAKENNITFVALDEDDFIEIPTIEEAEFINAHVDYANNEDKYLSWTTYNNFKNDYEKVYKLMQYDYEKGQIHGSNIGQITNDVFSFDQYSLIDDIWKTVDNNTTNNEVVYYELLSRLILDVYSEEDLNRIKIEILTEMLTNKLNELKENINSNTNKIQIIQNGLTLISDLSKENIIKATDIEKIVDFLDENDTIKELKYDLLGSNNENNLKVGYSDLLDVFSIELDIGKELVDDAKTLLNSYLLFSAINQVDNDVKLVLTDMLSYTYITNNQKFEDAIVNVVLCIETDDFKSFINNYIKDEITNNGMKLGLQTISKISGMVVNKIISSIPIIGPTWATSGTIISLYTSYYDNALDIDKRKIDIGYYLACSDIRGALANNIDMYSQKLKNNKTYVNAFQYHLAINYCKLIDSLANNFAINYMELFNQNYFKSQYNNNLYYHCIWDGINLKDIATILELENITGIKDLANTMGILSDRALNVHVTCLQIQKNLNNYRTALNNSYLCDSYLKNDASKNNTVNKILNGDLSFTIDNSSSSSEYHVGDTFRNIVNNSLVIVNCPTDIEIYNNDNNLIAILNESEIKYLIKDNNVVGSINEETDEKGTELTSKSKVFIMPNDYYFKIIGNDTGKMYLSSYSLSSKNDSNSVTLGNLNYSFNDIKIKENDQYIISKNDNIYILENTTQGITYNYPSNNTNKINSNNSTDNIKNTTNETTTTISIESSSFQSGDNRLPIVHLIIITFGTATYIFKKRK